MYEYNPKLDKRREKLTVLGLAVLGALFYGGSVLPNMPIPALLQLLAVVSWMTAAIIAVRYLLLNYRYSVVERVGDGGLDLVIVERRGRRQGVVCRVGLETVQSVMRLEKRSRRTVRERTINTRIYRYTAVLFGGERYLLEIRDGEDFYFLQILSDVTLEKLLMRH